MRARSPGFWLAALSIIGVVGLTVRDMDRTTPGGLAAVHGRVPELSARGSCGECHGGRRESLAEACSDCHTAVGEHIETGAGLHGALEEGVAERCASCHSEHHGADFPLVNRRSFALAGVRDPSEFAHELVGFEMEGRHLELECAECHESSEATVLEDGQHRYMGLAKDCKSCHEDPHAGRYRRACADCHGQTAFEELSTFVHDDRLPLVGGHADLGCVECHTDSGDHSVDFLAGVRQPPVWRDCVACHESPHANRFVENVARLVSLTSGGSCVECHAFEHETFRDDALLVTPELHAASGFTLDAPHDAADCADCHRPVPDDFTARFPGRAADECSACHSDPHAGQFAETAFAARGCLACHDRHRFEPHAFTPAKHARTALPLTGRHLDLDCNECHALPVTDGARVFHGTGTTCAGCHGDAHRGFFTERGVERGVQDAGRCEPCHATTAFSDVPSESFDHGPWTGFELVGAHAQSECESCHGRTDTPDELGRTFGWIAEHFGGEVEGCATCHADPHGAIFDGRRHPREVQGRAGCARCHVETSFRSLQREFDHFRWTGFELRGAHGSAACSDCHPAVFGDPTGRTFARALGGDCADCHGEPHAGQFSVSGRTDCARCHAGTRSFADLAFDHDRDSRFPLDDAHEAVACSACHSTLEVGGVEVVRYKPLGRECIDCHSKGRRAGRGRRK